MANLPHPVDDALIDLAVALDDMLALFLRDNELCDRERAVYATVKRAHAIVGRDRRIEQAFHYYQNNPDAPSAYGIEKLEAAGLEPIDLGQHRKARTVVPFRPRTSAG